MEKKYVVSPPLESRSVLKVWVPNSERDWSAMIFTVTSFPAPMVPCAGSHSSQAGSLSFRFHSSGMFPWFARTVVARVSSSPKSKVVPFATNAAPSTSNRTCTVRGTSPPTNCTSDFCSPMGRPLRSQVKSIACDAPISSSPLDGSTLSQWGKYISRKPHLRVSPPGFDRVRDTEVSTAPKSTLCDERTALAMRERSCASIVYRFFFLGDNGMLRVSQLS